MNIRRQKGSFQFEEDPFRKNVQGIGKIYHEVLLLMKLSQTKTNVKNMNFIYYDLYYTVIINRVDKKIVVDKCESKENDYNNFKDIVPNQYYGNKILKC